MRCTQKQSYMYRASIFYRKFYDTKKVHPEYTPKYTSFSALVSLVSKVVKNNLAAVCWALETAVLVVFSVRYVSG